VLIAANPYCDYEPDGMAAKSRYPQPEDVCFQWVILQRHGRRPLHVCARTLLRSSNFCVGLPTWSELILHETIGGRFVSSVTHHLTEPLGGAWQDAWLHESGAGLQKAIFDHDPAAAMPVLAGEPSATATNSAEMAEHVALAGLFRRAWFGMVLAVFGNGRR